MAISQSPTIYYYCPTNPSNFLALFANTKNLPLVISISYGWIESDFIYVGNSELEAFNIQAIKLSTMGVTIIRI